MAKNKASRYILPAPPAETPQQAASEGYHGEKAPVPAPNALDKPAAAYFLKLAAGDQHAPAEEAAAAVYRLGGVRWHFMRKKGLLARQERDTVVPPVSDFINTWYLEGWFQENKELLESKMKVSASYLLGWVQYKLHDSLGDWWKKEVKRRIKIAEGDVAYAKDDKGYVMPLGPIETIKEKADELRKIKGGLLYRCMQQLRDNRNKKSTGLLNLIRQELRRRAECTGDPEAQEELDRWKAECLKAVLDNSPSKNLPPKK